MGSWLASCMNHCSICTVCCTAATGLLLCTACRLLSEAEEGWLDEAAAPEEATRPDVEAAYWLLALIALLLEFTLGLHSSCTCHLRPHKLSCTQPCTATT